MLDIDMVGDSFRGEYPKCRLFAAKPHIGGEYTELKAFAVHALGYKHSSN